MSPTRTRQHTAPLRQSRKLIAELAAKRGLVGELGPDGQPWPWMRPMKNNRELWRERANWSLREWEKIVAWLDEWHRAHPGYERWFPTEPGRYGHEIPEGWDVESHMREAAAKFLAGDLDSIRDKPPYGVAKMIRRSRTNVGMKKR